MVPRPTTLTRSPVFPSILYCIASSSQQLAVLFTPRQTNLPLFHKFLPNCSSQENLIVSRLERMFLTRRRDFMIVQAFMLIVCVLLGASSASAQIDQILKGLGGKGKQSGPGDAKIGSGLKEALQIGTENAVKLTGKTDGYFKNQAIKILMPEKVRTVEKGLR